MFLLKILNKKIFFVFVALTGVLIILLFWEDFIPRKTFNLSYEEIPGRPAQLPKLAPLDFPVYPDVKIWRMTSRPPTDFTVGFGSSDTPQKVYDYLRQQAEESGWQITELKKLAFRAEKNKTTVTISVSQNKGEETAILEQVKFESGN